MILKQFFISVAALALLTIVNACSPNDPPKKEASTKAATVEDKQRGGPPRGRPPGGGEKRTFCEALKQGPMRSSEHGPMDNADLDRDGKLNAEEFAMVDPPYGFEGTDVNGYCVVTRKEVIAYASQAGRSYRKIGLGEFFDLIDTNGDNKATPTEVEAAHQSGLLARF